MELLKDWECITTRMGPSMRALGDTIDPTALERNNTLVEVLSKEFS